MSHYRSRLIAGVVVVACVVGFVGCSDDRYELVESQGLLIRLDKQSGDLFSIGERRNIEPISLEGNAELSLAMDWEPATIVRGTIVQGEGLGTLRTRWEDGRLEYQFKVEPPPDAFLQIRNTQLMYEVSLFDPQGFATCTISLPKNNFARTVGTDGRDQDIKADGTMDCPRSAYERATLPDSSIVVFSF